MSASARVLAYVRRNPDSTCRAIAEALQLEAPLVSAELRLLRKAGRVASGGKRTRGTTWRAV